MKLILVMLVSVVGLLQKGICAEVSAPVDPAWALEQLERAWCTNGESRAIIAGEIKAAITQDHTWRSDLSFPYTIAIAAECDVLCGSPQEALQLLDDNRNLFATVAQFVDAYSNMVSIAEYTTLVRNLAESGKARASKANDSSATARLREQLIRLKTTEGMLHKRAVCILKEMAGDHDTD